MSNIKMKLCVLRGDMSSDKTSEQYPEEPVCTNCIAAEQAKREDSLIVSVGVSVTDETATCTFCDCGFKD